MLTKDGSLADASLDVLNRALANDPNDLPGVQLMLLAVEGIAAAQGHNARWLRGCDCHEYILLSNVSLKKKGKLMADAGLDEGHCPFMGRRLCHLIHGGLDMMKNNLANAGTDEYNQLLLTTPDAQRLPILRFEQHVKTRLVSILDAKLSFVLRPPHLFAGLLGMYFGASITACVGIGRELVEYWQNLTEQESAHRVTTAFFTNERLVRELNSFISQEPPHTRPLHFFPSVFVFALRYQLLTCVGHFLEGRHRFIKMAISAGGSNSNPGLHSFRMRASDHGRTMLLPDFLNWVSVQWRLKTSLSDLLLPVCEESTFKNTTYPHKLSLVYNYNQASQFAVLPHVVACIATWKEATSSRSVAIAVPVTNLESLAISFIKHRLEVGATFALPGVLARLAAGRPESGSMISEDGFVVAYFAPRDRRPSLLRGDVVFTVVDPFPEKKKIFASVAEKKVTSEVVVRAHVPLEDDSETVPRRWAMERWDVRRWCSDDLMFSRFMGSLVRCDRVDESVRLGPARQLQDHAPPRVGVLSDVPTSADVEALLETGVSAEGEALLMKQLMERVDEDGSSLFDLPGVHVDLLERMCALGAIQAEVSEFGEVKYKLRPAGIRMDFDQTVPDPIFDIEFQRLDQAEARFGKLSKVELLLQLCQDGFRPMSAFAGSEPPQGPDSELKVFLPNLTRSKLYFVALLSRRSLFERGLRSISQRGPHAYYQCCLALSAFDELNAIVNVDSTPNETFKALLVGRPTEALAIEDDDEDHAAIEDVVPLPPPRLPPPLAAAPRAGPGAMTQRFVFPCPTATGATPLTIHLDGWSHQSGRRRVYAQCLHDGHDRCHHYKFLHHFDEPWKAVAYLLCYIRGGRAAADKLDHFRNTPPTEQDLQAVFSEVEPHAASIVL